MPGADLVKSKKLNRRSGSVLHVLARVVRRNPGLAGVHHRGLAGDSHGLGNSGETERNAPLHGASHQDLHPFLNIGTEAGEFRREDVIAGRQVREAVLPGGIRYRRARTAGKLIRGDADRRPGENESLVVGDRAQDRAGDLAERRAGGKDESERQQASKQLSMVDHQNLRWTLTSPETAETASNPSVGPYARLPLRVNHLLPIPTGAQSPVIQSDPRLLADHGPSHIRMPRSVPCRPRTCGLDRAGRSIAGGRIAARSGRGPGSPRIRVSAPRPLRPEPPSVFRES